MNLILLFVVASLTLVGAMVANAVPNMVQAVPPDKPIKQYCYGLSVGGVVSQLCAIGSDIFNTKGECKKAAKDDTRLIVEPCHLIGS